MATSPRSPEPHGTSRPSSVTTRVYGPSRNDAVSAASADDIVLEAMPMASLEPSESTMISRSLWASRPFFVAVDHITPLDTITRNDEMSQRCGSASSARRIGLANASPTIDIELMRSACTVSSSSSGSNLLPSIVTTLPPIIRLLNALNNPVPCINGAAGRLRGPGLLTRSVAACRSCSGGRRLRFAASSAPNRSSWRHITPFGIPVVPPVYSSTR